MSDDATRTMPQPRPQPRPGPRPWTRAHADPSEAQSLQAQNRSPSSVTGGAETLSGPAATAPLAAEGVSAGYGGAPILEDVTLSVRGSQVTTVIGPNGCGKSTLLRVLGNILRPSSGCVRVHGAPIRTFRPRQLATRLSLLPQAPAAPEGMTVADLTARGRQPYQPWYRQWSEHDEAIIAEALAATGVTELADRSLSELSGGQRQRAWIAMTLAQQTDILLLDEPTTYLDLAHAAEVLDLVVGLRRSTGRTIVMVLHDLNLAARYSDHLVVMRDGRIVSEGPPASILRADLLREVFGLRANVFPDPVDGLPTVVPAGHA